MKSSGLFGRFGEPAASIFRDNFASPRFVRLALALPQLCLFASPCVCIVVVPRGHETLVNFCWTAWRHNPQGCARRGIRLWVGTSLLKMTQRHG